MVNSTSTKNTKMSPKTSTRGFKKLPTTSKAPRNYKELQEDNDTRTNKPKARGQHNRTVETHRKHKGSTTEQRTHKNTTTTNKPKTQGQHNRTAETHRKQKDSTAEQRPHKTTTTTENQKNGKQHEGPARPLPKHAGEGHRPTSRAKPGRGGGDRRVSERASPTKETHEQAHGRISKANQEPNKRNRNKTGHGQTPRGTEHRKHTGEHQGWGKEGSARFVRHIGSYSRAPPTGRKMPGKAYGSCVATALIPELRQRDGKRLGGEGRDTHKANTQDRAQREHRGTQTSTRTHKQSKTGTK